MYLFLRGRAKLHLQLALGKLGRGSTTLSQAPAQRQPELKLCLVGDEDRNAQPPPRNLAGGNDLFKILSRSTPYIEHPNHLWVSFVKVHSPPVESTDCDDTGVPESMDQIE